MVCPYRWVYLLTYWLLGRHGVTPYAFFSDPSSFPAAPFPPFYSAHFSAWIRVDGRASCSGLGLSSPDGSACPVDSISCKAVHSLLSLNPVTPHCVSKFLRSFSHLDWPVGWWCSLFLPLDRRVSDLNWQIAHGVLYTAACLSSFCYSIPTFCFCGYHLQCLEHLFFACPLAQSGYAWIGTQLSLASPLAPSIDVRHTLFGFSSDELWCFPPVFAYLLNVCKYLVWAQRNDFCFRSVPLSFGLPCCCHQGSSTFLPSSAF